MRSEEALGTTIRGIPIRDQDRFGARSQTRCDLHRKLEVENVHSESSECIIGGGECQRTPNIHTRRNYRGEQCAAWHQRGMIARKVNEENAVHDG